MDREIKIAKLTTCGVSDDGRSVDLRALDGSGEQVAVKFSFDQAQGVMMTLPRILSRALQVQTGNPNNRFVFPLGQWSVERSKDARCLIVTLRTDDGFDVSFAMPAGAACDLGKVLAEEISDSQSSSASQEPDADLTDRLH